MNSPDFISHGAAGAGNLSDRVEDRDLVDLRELVRGPQARNQLLKIVDPRVREPFRIGVQHHLALDVEHP